MKRSLKWVSNFTLIAFLVTQVVGPSQGFAAPIVEVPVKASFQLSVPSALGTVEELIQAPSASGSTNSPSRAKSKDSGQARTLIHLQTAHGNYKAQKNIQAILHHLKDTYGIKTLFIEGSAFQLQPEILRLYPEDMPATMEIADRLTRKALVKGPELFLLEAEDAEAYGIESVAPYVENGVAIKNVLTQRDQSENFLREMDVQIGRLTSPYLNSELRAFLNRLNAFQAKEVPFEKWLGELRDYAKDLLKTDLADPNFQFEWPMLVRIFKLVQFEAELDRGALTKERNRFLEALKRRTQGNDLEMIQKLLTDPVTRHRLPDPDTGLLFERMVEALGPQFDFASYPNVSRLIGHLILQSELKADRLFAEVNGLTDKIANRLAKEKIEKEIVALLKDYTLLQKLFALELTPSDYGQILKRGDLILPKRIIKRFLDLNPKKRVRNVEFKNLDEITELFDSALDFYHTVKERDKSMLENAENKMTELGVQKAVVITGGFHAEPFKTYFTDKNFNYALISPQIDTTEGLEAYHESILQKNPATFSTQTRETHSFALPLDQLRALVNDRTIRYGVGHIRDVSTQVTHSDRIRSTRFAEVHGLALRSESRKGSTATLESYSFHGVAKASRFPSEMHFSILGLEGDAHFHLSGKASKTRAQYNVFHGVMAGDANASRLIARVEINISEEGDVSPIAILSTHRDHARSAISKVSRKIVNAGLPPRANNDYIVRREKELLSQFSSTALKRNAKGIKFEHNAPSRSTVWFSATRTSIKRMFRSGDEEPFLAGYTWLGPNPVVKLGKIKSSAVVVVREEFLALFNHVNDAEDLFKVDLDHMPVLIMGESDPKASQLTDETRDLLSLEKWRQAQRRHLSEIGFRVGRGVLEIGVGQPYSTENYRVLKWGTMDELVRWLWIYGIDASYTVDAQSSGKQTNIQLQADDKTISINPRDSQALKTTLDYILQRSESRALETENGVRDRIKDVLNREYGVERDDIQDTSRWWEDLGLDSLHIAELIMDLEEEFERELQDGLSLESDFEKTNTFGEAVVLIHEKYKPDARSESRAAESAEKKEGHFKVIVELSAEDLNAKIMLAYREKTWTEDFQTWDAMTRPVPFGFSAESLAEKVLSTLSDMRDPVYEYVTRQRPPEPEQIKERAMARIVEMPFSIDYPILEGFSTRITHAIAEDHAYEGFRYGHQFKFAIAFSDIHKFEHKADEEAFMTHGFVLGRNNLTSEKDSSGKPIYYYGIVVTTDVDLSKLLEGIEGFVAEVEGVDPTSIDLKTALQNLPRSESRSSESKSADENDSLEAPRERAGFFRGIILTLFWGGLLAAALALAYGHYSHEKGERLGMVRGIALAHHFDLGSTKAGRDRVIIATELNQSGRSETLDHHLAKLKSAELKKRVETVGFLASVSKTISDWVDPPHRAEAMNAILNALRQQREEESHNIQEFFYDTVIDRLTSTRSESRAVGLANHRSYPLNQRLYPLELNAALRVWQTSQGWKQDRTVEVQHLSPASLGRYAHYLDDGGFAAIPNLTTNVETLVAERGNEQPFIEKALNRSKEKAVTFVELHGAGHEVPVINPDYQGHVVVLVHRPQEALERMNNAAYAYPGEEVVFQNADAIVLLGDPSIEEFQRKFPDKEVVMIPHGFFKTKEIDLSQLEQDAIVTVGSVTTWDLKDMRHLDDAIHFSKALRGKVDQGKRVLTYLGGKIINEDLNRFRNQKDFWLLDNETLMAADDRDFTDLDSFREWLYAGADDEQGGRRIIIRTEQLPREHRITAWEEELISFNLQFYHEILNENRAKEEYSGTAHLLIGDSILVLLDSPSAHSIHHNENYKVVMTPIDGTEIDYEVGAERVAELINDSQGKRRQLLEHNLDAAKKLTMREIAFAYHLLIQHLVRSESRVEPEVYQVPIREMSRSVLKSNFKGRLRHGKFEQAELPENAQIWWLDRFMLEYRDGRIHTFSLERLSINDQEKVISAIEAIVKDYDDYRIRVTPPHFFPTPGKKRQILPPDSRNLGTTRIEILPPLRSESRLISESAIEIVKNTIHQTLSEDAAIQSKLESQLELEANIERVTLEFLKTSKKTKTDVFFHDIEVHRWPNLTDDIVVSFSRGEFDLIHGGAQGLATVIQTVHAIPPSFYLVRNGHAQLLSESMDIGQVRLDVSPRGKLTLFQGKNQINSAQLKIENPISFETPQFLANNRIDRIFTHYSGLHSWPWVHRDLAGSIAKWGRQVAEQDGSFIAHSIWHQDEPVKRRGIYVRRHERMMQLGSDTKSYTLHEWTQAAIKDGDAFVLVLGSDQQEQVDQVLKFIELGRPLLVVIPKAEEANTVRDAILALQEQQRIPDHFIENNVVIASIENKPWNAKLSGSYQWDWPSIAWLGTWSDHFMPHYLNQIDGRSEARVPTFVSENKRYNLDAGGVYVDFKMTPESSDEVQLKVHLYRDRSEPEIIHARVGQTIEIFRDANGRLSIDSAELDKEIMLTLTRLEDAGHNEFQFQYQDHFRERSQFDVVVDKAGELSNARVTLNDDRFNSFNHQFEISFGVKPLRRAQELAHFLNGEGVRAVADSEWTITINNDEMSLPNTSMSRLQYNIQTAIEARNRLLDEQKVSVDFQFPDEATGRTLIYVKVGDRRFENDELTRLLLPSIVDADQAPDYEAGEPAKVLVEALEIFLEVSAIVVGPETIQFPSTRALNLRTELPAVMTEIATALEAQGTRSEARAIAMDDIPGSKLKEWITKTQNHVGADNLVFVDESDDAALIEQALEMGRLTKIRDSEGNFTGNYFTRSHKRDTARAVERTFVATNSKKDKGPFVNWRNAENLKTDIRKQMKGRSGKTLYAIPYLMGPVGSELSEVGIQLTDSIYVAINTIRMAKVGRVALEHAAKQGLEGSDIIKGVHVTGDLDTINDSDRYYAVFPEENLVMSYGSEYGGNVLFGKKFVGLRLKDWKTWKNQARHQLAEHMLTIGIEDTQKDPADPNRIRYISAAFPSASGKTNLAMLQPPASLADRYKVHMISDDITWFDVERDSPFYGQQPENGLFGVVPGTSEKTNPNAMRAIGPGTGTIFTNVASKPYDDGTVEIWWEDLTEEYPEDVTGWIDWKGERIDGRPADRQKIKSFKDDAERKEFGWDHPNSRFTARVGNVPNRSEEITNPKGVPVEAIFFGGRLPKGEALIRMVSNPKARNFADGIYDGAVMSVLGTAAAGGEAGKLKRDPFANRPFLSYPLGERLKQELRVYEAAGEAAPAIFHVNFFRERFNRQAGEDKFLWPGFGENLRLILWALEAKDDIEKMVAEGHAKKTPVGYMPTAKGLNLDGLEIPAEDLQALLDYVFDYWETEIPARRVFLETIPNVPQQIWDAQERLEDAHALFRSEAREKETREGALERTKEILWKQYVEPEQQISASSRLRDDFGIDSLDLIDLIVDLEEEFDVYLGEGGIEKEAGKIETVDDLVTLMLRYQPEIRSETRTAQDELTPMLFVHEIAQIVMLLGISRDQIPRIVETFRSSIDPSTLVSELVRFSEKPEGQVLEVLDNIPFFKIHAAQYRVRQASAQESSTVASHLIRVTVGPEHYTIGREPKTEATPSSPLDQLLEVKHQGAGQTPFAFRDDMGKFVDRFLNRSQEKDSQAPDLQDRVDQVDDFLEGIDLRSIRYVVTSGIGANEMYSHQLARELNEYFKSRDIDFQWIVVNNPAHEKERIPADSDNDNTLVFEMSRSGSTKETVDFFNATSSRFRKRIVAANSGALNKAAELLSDLNENGTKVFIIDDIPGHIGGRQMNRKTLMTFNPLYLALRAGFKDRELAQFYLNVYAESSLEANDELDYALTEKTPAVELAEVLLRQRDGAGRYKFSVVYDDSLRAVAKEFMQLNNEGANKNIAGGTNLNILEGYNLSNHEAGLFEGVVGQDPSHQLPIFLLNTNSSGYAEALELIDRLEQQGIPVIVIQAGLNASKSLGDNLSTLAKLSNLIQDMVVYFTYLTGQDANSNPAVKFVREITAVMFDIVKAKKNSDAEVTITFEDVVTKIKEQAATNNDKAQSVIQQRLDSLDTIIHFDEYEKLEETLEKLASALDISEQHVTEAVVSVLSRDALIADIGEAAGSSVPRALIEAAIDVTTSATQIGTQTPDRDIRPLTQQVFLQNEDDLKVSVALEADQQVPVDQASLLEEQIADYLFSLYQDGRSEDFKYFPLVHMGTDESNPDILAIKQAITETFADLGITSPFWVTLPDSAHTGLEALMSHPENVFLLSIITTQTYDGDLGNQVVDGNITVNDATYVYGASNVTRMALGGSPSVMFEIENSRNLPQVRETITNALSLFREKIDSRSESRRIQEALNLLEPLKVAGAVGQQLNQIRDQIASGTLRNIRAAQNALALLADQQRPTSVSQSSRRFSAFAGRTPTVARRVESPKYKLNITDVNVLEQTASILADIKARQKPIQRSESRGNAVTLEHLRKQPILAGVGLDSKGGVQIRGILKKEAPLETLESTFAAIRVSNLIPTAVIDSLTDDSIESLNLLRVYLRNNPTLIKGPVALRIKQWGNTIKESLNLQTLPFAGLNIVIFPESILEDQKSIKLLKGAYTNLAVLVEVPKGKTTQALALGADGVLIQDPHPESFYVVRSLLSVNPTPIAGITATLPFPIRSFLDIGAAGLVVQVTSQHAITTLAKSFERSESRESYAFDELPNAILSILERSTSERIALEYPVEISVAYAGKESHPIAFADAEELARYLTSRQSFEQDPIEKALAIIPTSVGDTNPDRVQFSVVAYEGTFIISPVRSESRGINRDLVLNLLGDPQVARGDKADFVAEVKENLNLAVQLLIQQSQDDTPQNNFKRLAEVIIHAMLDQKLSIDYRLDLLDSLFLRIRPVLDQFTFDPLVLLETYRSYRGPEDDRDRQRILSKLTELGLMDHQRFNALSLIEDAKSLVVEYRNQDLNASLVELESAVADLVSSFDDALAIQTKIELLEDQVLPRALEADSSIPGDQFIAKLREISNALYSLEAFRQVIQRLKSVHTTVRFGRSLETLTPVSLTRAPKISRASRQNRIQFEFSALSAVVGVPPVLVAEVFTFPFADLSVSPFGIEILERVTKTDSASRSVGLHAVLTEETSPDFDSFVDDTIKTKIGLALRNNLDKLRAPRSESRIQIVDKPIDLTETFSFPSRFDRFPRNLASEVTEAYLSVSAMAGNIFRLRTLAYGHVAVARFVGERNLLGLSPVVLGAGVGIENMLSDFARSIGAQTDVDVTPKALYLDRLRADFSVSADELGSLVDAGRAAQLLKHPETLFQLLQILDTISQAAEGKVEDLLTVLVPSNIAVTPQHFRNQIRQALMNRNLFTAAEMEAVKSLLIRSQDFLGVQIVDSEDFVESINKTAGGQDGVGVLLQDYLAVENPARFVLPNNAIKKNIQAIPYLIAELLKAVTAVKGLRADNPKDLAELMEGVLLRESTVMQLQVIDKNGQSYYVVGTLSNLIKHLRTKKLVDIQA